jgi:single-strand DNA-binding protein
MNNVCLVGRLTRDPELRTTSSGLSTCRFSIAVDGRPGANGEAHTDFINIVVWRNQAENVAKYCKKGSMVGVVGRIQTGSYQAQDGQTRYTTDVVADNVRFLSSKNSGEGDSLPDYSMGDQNSQPADLANDPFKDFGSEVVLSDDDLPF